MPSMALGAGAATLTMLGAEVSIGPLLPVVSGIIVAVAGALVNIYYLKPKAEGIISQASRDAVASVRESLEELREELRGARERMAQLEMQLREARSNREKVMSELRVVQRRVHELEALLLRHGVHLDE